MRTAATNQDASGMRAMGLAPWQERKVLRHVGEHLGRPIRTLELASLVGLSVSQFSRRFRGSFGVTPRAYLLRIRLDRAKTLMRQSRATLCEIALDSGFCDQAHMSRQFQAFVGDTPRRWRRENSAPLTTQTTGHAG